MSQVREYYNGDINRIKELVKCGNILNLTKKSESINNIAQEDIIYRKGKMSNSFALILNGKMTVLVGKDQFRVEVGPWSVLGADSLTMPEGTYIPDFSAMIASDTARIITFNPFRPTHLDDAGLGITSLTAKLKKSKLHGSESGNGAGPSGSSGPTAAGEISLHRLPSLTMDTQQDGNIISRISSKMGRVASSEKSTPMILESQVRDENGSEKVNYTSVRNDDTA